MGPGGYQETFTPGLVQGLSQPTANPPVPPTNTFKRGPTIRIELAE